MDSKEEPTPAPKINAVSLYVTTAQIVVRSDPKDPNSWEDLYRLMPYLRNSLCCAVCLELLVDPYTPKVAPCQHHVCKNCKGKRKQIKPGCKQCKDCKDYEENKRLRLILQCYKKMCVTLLNSRLFKSISLQASQPGTEFHSCANYFISLVKEGGLLEDKQ